MVGTAVGVGASLLSGSMSSSAASDAADAEARAGNQSIAFQKDALKQIRGDLAPYRDAGITALYGGPQYDQQAYDKALADFNALPALGGKTKTNKRTGATTTTGGKGFLTLAQYQALNPADRINYEKNAQGNFIRKAPQLSDFKLNPSGGLLDLVTNPEAQKNFITNNPFFDALAKQSTDTLLNNQAARGKVGSGGTAQALQNSLLLLGNDLLNQNIGQRQTIANMGESAAAQTGTATQNTAAGVGNTLEGIGNARAAGAVGSANAWNTALGGISSLGPSLGAYGGGYSNTSAGRIDWYPSLNL
jgi:hypothetical protein